MTKRHAIADSLTPRLLNTQAAAEYCGLSPAILKQVCPVPRVVLAGRIKRYDRVKLDEWLDRLSGGTEDSRIDWLGKLSGSR